MPGSGSIRVNIAGGDYTDGEGCRWQADKAYGPGSWGCANMPETDVLTTADDIAGTGDAALYRSMRTGERLVYRFDVPNGSYAVSIHFAEIYWESSDAERQEVYVQGKRVLEDFNIYDDAGHDAALVKSFEARVTKRTLEVRFEATSLPMHNGARACAIAVEPISKARKRKPHKRR